MPLLDNPESIAVRRFEHPGQFPNPLKGFVQMGGDRNGVAEVDLCVRVAQGWGQIGGADFG